MKAPGWLLTLWICCLSQLFANGESLMAINPDIRDQAQLQRGAKVFMNYCSGCHSLRYLRYNRMAQDLGLTTFDGTVDSPLLKNNLVFTTSAIYDPIQISLPAVDAREWFGRMPPDLSLTAREKGPRWIYTFLKSFYHDPKRPFHTNNLLMPDLSMPNVLSPLSGVTQLRINSDNTKALVLIQDGAMTEQAFDAMIQDVVTFLTYTAEPTKLERIHLGYKVLAFLIIWFVVLSLLCRLYWKKLPD